MSTMLGFAGWASMEIESRNERMMGLQRTAARVMNHDPVQGQARSFSVQRTVRLAGSMLLFEFL